MKKIFTLLILGVSLTLTSCKEPTVTKSDLPIEVVSLKESNKFDTILQIKTEEKVFNFDQKKEYISTYNVISKEHAYLVILLVSLALDILIILLR